MLKEKLHSFLATFTRMDNPGIVLFGAIVSEKKTDAKEILALCDKSGFVKVKIDIAGLDKSVKDLLEVLGKNNIAVLEIKSGWPQDFLNVLREISENKVNLALAGTDERLIKSPVTKSGKVLGVGTAAEFDAMKNQELFAPVVYI